MGRVEAHGAGARGGGNGRKPVPHNALADDSLEGGRCAPLHDVGIEEPGQDAVPELRRMVWGVGGEQRAKGRARGKSRPQ